jgi:hypothetical protein
MTPYASACATIHACQRVKQLFKFFFIKQLKHVVGSQTGQKSERSKNSRGKCDQSLGGEAD